MWKSLEQTVLMLHLNFALNFAEQAAQKYFRGSLNLCSASVFYGVRLQGFDIAQASEDKSKGQLSLFRKCQVVLSTMEYPAMV